VDREVGRQNKRQMEREREKKNPEQSGVTQLVIYKYIKFFVIAHKEKR
jgi:hypothetical protein